MNDTMFGGARMDAVRSVVVVAALAMFSTLASAAAFTPGSIVAYRVGNGTAAVNTSGSANPVFLDEYSPNGTLLQSIALPTAAGTAPLTNALTASSTGSEGLMMRSVDGTCLTLPGYAAAVNTANIAASTTIQRDVAFVAAAGTIDTTTTLGTSAFMGSNVRGAVADTCGHAWMSGNGTAKANYGVWYAVKGATGATQLYNVNAQGIAISNGQLLASIGSSTFDTVGSGLPIGAGQTVAALSANIATSNYRGIAFLALQSGSSSSDTLYLADNVSNVIAKYVRTGNAWTAAGGLSTAAISGVNTHGLMAANLGDGSVALYFTSSKGGIIYRAIDSSGPTGSLAASTPFAVFASASGQPANAFYYGLAPAPQTALPAAVPNAPTNANSTAVTSTSFTANWTAAVAGSALSYYVVDVSYASNFASLVQSVLVAGGTTSASFSGLTNSTVYYRVRAVNDLGASADLVSGINVPQTIFFGTPPTIAVGGTGTVTATSSSGLAVGYSSQTLSVCSISGATVTGLSTGSCIIAADQAGNGQYAPATEVTQSFSVGGASQFITFLGAPSGMVVAGTGLLSASASSGLPVTYSSATPTSCSVIGATVVGLNVGNCTVLADQAGNASYLPAPEASENFTIGQASQSISFGSAPIVQVNGTGTLSAQASSGLTVTFASTTPAVCTVSGATVSGVASGNCNVGASQAGNANYTAAASMTQSFTIGAATQTVSFTALPVGLVGGNATLSASASSGLTVSFGTTTPAICTVSGNVVTGVAAGTCAVAGDQAGNANYGAAATAYVSFSVNQALSALTPGSLIINTVSNVNNGSATLDTAVAMVLQQFQPDSNGATATPTGVMVLPQVANGNQSAISGEYGSASEGHLQQSANGQYLTVMGYGVNAAAFGSAATTVYGTAALGQSTSLVQSAQTPPYVTTVPRVVALISANGSVDTSTALTGIYNQNNPRSAATIDGSAFWTSGQGQTSTDPTQGVAYAPIGASTATPVDNSTDTRVVSILNTGSGNALYVSRDRKAATGANNFTNISLLAAADGSIPTTSIGLVTTHEVPPASPLSLGANNGSINLTAATANGVNNARIGSFVYLSPQQYFLASPTVMYVTDSGAPKAGSANAAGLGEGGLQKWILLNGTWTLAYDLVNGLTLANNGNANANTPSAAGVTGLFGLAGRVVNGQVQLFASSYGLNELSQSYLFEITDNLAATSIAQVANEQFNVLYTDPSGQTLVRGVAFAPGLPQQITFTYAPKIGVGGTDVVTASAGASGNAVTFSSLTASVCTVSGGNVTAVSAGTCTIVADQAGNAQYSPAVEAALSFTIGGTTQTISFGSLPDLLVGASQTLNASASSGLALVYTGATPIVCTVSGNSVTAVTAGTCAIAASQSGNSNYAYAQASASFQVTQPLQAQTINFPTISDLTIGAAPFTVTVSASSGLPATLASQSPAVCSVSGATVTLLAVGSCVLQASQAGDGVTWSAATPVLESFNVDASSGGGGSSTQVPVPLWALVMLGLGLGLVVQRAARRSR